MREIPRDWVQSYKEPFGFRAAMGQSAVAFAAGVMAALGHAPFSLIFLSLPGFAAIFWLIRRAATPRGSTFLGFSAGFGYFVTSLFWIVEPFLVDAARHAWMAPFALIFMAGGLAVFWAIATRVTRWLAGDEPTGLTMGVAWVVTMTLAELARAHVLTGFPWAMPAYIWTETAFIQMAAIFGPHGLNFLTFSFAAALTGLAFPGAAAKIAGILGLFAPTGIALGLAQVLPPVVPGDGPVIRLVQPNAPQHLKWKRDMMPIFFDRAIGLTSAAAQEAPELVIWPETSAPGALRGNDQVLRRIAEAAGGADVILGAIRRVDNQSFNSLLVVGPDGRVSGTYDKSHLVPFGEYMPLVPQIAALGWEDLADQIGTGYSAGEGPVVLEASVGGLFRPLICYEAIFPEEIGTDERPRWLLQITNDAWFGDIAGPYQHLAQARMRAIEQGLPMVRVANTGVSAVIDARGRVVASLPLGKHGHLDARLPDPLVPTAYSILGDWPVLILMIMCGFATLTQRVRNRE